MKKKGAMVGVIKLFGDFLLSSWIWNITFDWFHPIITAIVMFCLLRFIMRKGRLESLAISICAQLFAFGLLTVNVTFGLVKLLGWQYDALKAGQALQMMHVFIPTLWLGLIYAIFQSLFFLFGRLIWRYNLIAFLVLTWVSNSIGVVVSYTFIRMIEICYYID